MRWLRAFVAAGLSVLLPGAGHALARDWVRALLFAGLYLATVAILLPSPDQVATAETFAETVDLVTAEIGTVGRFFLSFVALFAAIDATFRTLGVHPTGEARGAGDAPSCPQCGKELDEDLAFCHWCTTRLEARDDDAPFP